MYSYDVAPTARPSTGRTIPGMRPSFDADHPSSPTPIYDALYSEYRRLFRALPGDRTDEEQLRFSSFAAQAGVSYPQHQVFETFAGHAQGTPQFMTQTYGRAAGAEHQQGRAATGQASGGTGQGWVAAGYLAPAAATAPGTGAAGGRHRSMLSLPAGRLPEQQG
ncbi:hypothetical protein [Kitasatospora paranensis]|uniref:Uncharacterized protein n=1 Tax=Kitasatospora paranensis TaxID=258053 RepID=A0ABW2FR00_9ACTN